MLLRSVTHELAWYLLCKLTPGPRSSQQCRRQGAPAAAAAGPSCCKPPRTRRSPYGPDLPPLTPRPAPGFANQSVPLYLSEMAPYTYRGALNLLFQLATTVGILVAQVT